MASIGDAADPREQERMLDNLLDRIFIGLRDKYGKFEDCPLIFPAIVRTIIWNICDEPVPKVDTRKNKKVSAEILEKRQASVIFDTEIDGPICACVGRENEVLRKYLLSEMLKRIIDDICAKAWSDYHQQKSRPLAKQ